MNVGGVGNNNWWANASGRNPGIGNWNQPLAVRQGGTLHGGASDASRNSIVSLRETSGALSQALNAIRGIGNMLNPPMQARQPNSANTDALAIRSFDSSRLRGSVATQDFSVEVLQVAQAQTHEGQELNASARATESGFSVGDHHIAINIGDRQFDFHFTVSENDTTRDVQQRIASAINSRSDVAVTANVNFDAEAGTSALVLRSSQTGVAENVGAGEANFSVRSVTGNAVEASGVDVMTQRAQDAAFRVNRGFTGALQTSRSNEVDLGFGITAELRETGTTEIEMGRDTITQQNAFRHMVNSFNELVSAASSASRGGSLSSELGGIVRNFSSQLERIGISLNSEGRMQIDEARMAAAAESGELENFANRDGFNFMSRLTRTADNVSGNPAAFTDQAASSMGNIDPASFMNSGVNFSPTQTVMMTRFMNLGMLFDSLG